MLKNCLRLVTLIIFQWMSTSGSRAIRQYRDFLHRLNFPASRFAVMELTSLIRAVVGPALAATKWADCFRVLVEMVLELV